MRLVALIGAGFGCLALAACGDSADPTEAIGTLDQTSQSSEEGGAPVGEILESDTQLEARVATIGLLNKRNNVSRDFEMRPGDVREVGPVILRLATCERSAQWEMIEQTAAFVQVDVLERGQSDHSRVFSGWLFKENPSVNVVEHPIYDVWVKDCAMRLPGDEGASAVSAEEAG